MEMVSWSALLIKETVVNIFFHFVQINIWTTVMMGKGFILWVCCHVF